MQSTIQIYIVYLELKFVGTNGGCLGLENIAMR